MHQKFARTSNVTAFYDAYGRLNQRGAEEASWMLAIAVPGLGKTKTVHNFAIESRGVYLRAKANWTAPWMLHEIADSLAVDTEGKLRAVYARIIQGIIELDAPIVVDEARNMLHDAKLLETLRDLSDTTGATVVLSGEEFVLGRLTNRFPQIRSRISEVVTFRVATFDDVRSCCNTLSEIPMADDLIAEILKQSRGFYREIKNAIATAERIGKRDKLELITASDVKNVRLCQDRTDARSRDPRNE